MWLEINLSDKVPQQKWEISKLKLNFTPLNKNDTY